MHDVRRGDAGHFPSFQEPLVIRLVALSQTYTAKGTMYALNGP